MKLTECYLCGSRRYKTIHKGVREEETIDVLQCCDCGLVRLSEVMDEPDEFYRESGMRNGGAESLEKLRMETKDDDERRFRFTEKMITNKRVLDFGCGDGGYLLRAKAVATEVSGVEMERAVREALQREGVQCYERIMDAGQVDVVTMFHVLEHLPNPVEALREIMDYIVSNGLLIVEVPNADDALLSLYQCKAFADFTYWKCHIYLYTMDTLRLLAKKAGLQVKFMRQIQRYPLENHLYWLSKGKPGGHCNWGFFSDDILNRQYGERLSSLGIADTIVCGLCKM